MATVTLSYSAVPNKGSDKPAGIVRELYDSPEAALRRAREVIDSRQGFMPQIADETETVIMDTRGIVQALGLEIARA